MKFETVIPWLLPAALSLSTTAQDPLAEFDHVETASPYERPDLHHATVRGQYVRNDGTPLAGARVILYGYQPFFWALPLAETVTADDGTFEVGDISGRGRIGIWVLSPADEPFAREYRNLILVSGRASQLRPIPVFREELDLDVEPAILRGKVLGKDGSPIAGAYLRLEGEEGRFDPGAVAITGQDGSFEALSRTGPVDNASLFLQNMRLRIEQSNGQTMLSKSTLRWNLDLHRAAELLLQHTDFEGFGLNAVEDGPPAEFSFERGGVWYPYTDNVAWLVRSSSGSGSGRIRATADGYLPRLQSVPRNNTFDFTDSAPMRLRVRSSDGSAIPDAWVDVCLPPDDSRGREVEIASYRTDAAGQLQSLGDPGAQYVVYAYANGYSAIRAEWRQGSELQLTLSPQDAHVSIRADSDDQWIAVRPWGSFANVALVYPRAGVETDIPLAAGRYEITRYEGNSVAGAQAIELTSGQTLSPALEDDLRPQVTLKLPALAGGEWWAYASRGAVGGMVPKWRARSGGETVPSTEVPVQVDAMEGVDNSFTFRFPTSGRYTILCGHPTFKHRLFRDINASFGSAAEIELADGDGELKGSIAPYPRLWDLGAQHGIAGPRFTLLPDRSTASRWGVLVALPDPKDFALDHVPVGDYVMHHHLYETEMFDPQSATYGATPVRIASGQATDLGELGRGPVEDLEVELRDPEGEPITGTLAIRDRMYESWAKVVEEGSTLRFALDPIPAPPSVRLEGGRALLQSVREGRIEFILTLEDGRRIDFERDVDPGETNEIVLTIPPL